MVVELVHEMERLTFLSFVLEKMVKTKKQLWDETIAFPCEQKQKPRRNRSVPKFLCSRSWSED